MSDTIATLRRGERFTVPELPHVPVLTFESLDAYRLIAYSTTDDGQVCQLAPWTPVVREGRDG